MLCEAAKATALIAAAFAGDVDTIAALLDGKASVEASTASGVTALQAAVEGAESCQRTFASLSCKGVAISRMSRLNSGDIS
jgi:hypothetical protein